MIGFPLRSRNCLGRDFVCILSPDPPAKITAMFIILIWDLKGLKGFLLLLKDDIYLMSVTLIPWR